LKACSPIARSW